MDEELYNDIDAVRIRLSDSAILEQMAEECCELGQALLKKSRKLRGENFTPLTLDEIHKNITEEFTDVIVCSEILGLQIDMDIFANKLHRWLGRLENENN